MFEGLYTIELHRNGKIETFEISNHVTRYTKYRSYLPINRIGIRRDGTFEDMYGTRNMELLGGYINANTLPNTGMTWLSTTNLNGSTNTNAMEHVEDGYIYKFRTTSFFSGPCTVYSLSCGVYVNQSSGVDRCHFVSFVDLPSELVLLSSDFLYAWYSLKHRWPYA